MSIVGETGTGVTGAEAYGADPVALITTYWSLRTNDPLSAAWAAATTAIKEGAARTAAAYLDGTYGPFYIGIRKTSTQGLLWPRIEGKDDLGADIPLKDELGNALPALPPQLISAMAELAARAISGPLEEDAISDHRLTREKVGNIEFEYAEGAGADRFGVVAAILFQILTGYQPGQTSPSWHWR